jgi:hypothetical protein
MSSTRKGLIIVWSLALLLATPVLLTKVMKIGFGIVKKKNKK